MLKIKGLLLGSITSALVAFSITGCSKTTHVEEKVNVNPTTEEAVVVPETAEKDVNVNVHVNGNTAPAPREVVQKETKIINVVREQPKQEEKKVVINNVTNVTPPKETVINNEITTEAPAGTNTVQTTTTTSTEQH